MISEGIISSSFQGGIMFGLVLAALLVFVGMLLWRRLSRPVYRMDELPEAVPDEYYPVELLQEHMRRQRRRHYR